MVFRARSDASCNIAVRIQSQFAPKTQVAEFVGSFAPARHYSWSKKLWGYDATVAQMQCRRKNTFLSLSFENAENIINAFVTSKLDYCNSLLSGGPNSSLRTLQLCKTQLHVYSLETGRTQHISPVPTSLHWFPVSSCLEFKIQLIAYKERSVRLWLHQSYRLVFAAGVHVCQTACGSQWRAPADEAPFLMRLICTEEGVILTRSSCG